MSLQYRDLFNFTDIYKLLFIPYVSIRNHDLANSIYGTDLYKAIVNVYPSWDEHTDCGLHNDHIFLVLDMTKIISMSDVRLLKTNHKNIKKLYFPDMLAGSPNRKNANNLLIISIQLPKKLCSLFKEGHYSKMFTKQELFDNIKAFTLKENGYEIEGSNVSKEFHILVKSKNYEKILAAQLGIDYKEFENKLTEFKPPYKIEEEQLNLELLIKQLHANEW